MDSSFLTLSGAVVSLDGNTLNQAPQHDCRERAYAAAQAGFTGMGLAAADLDHCSLASLAGLPVRITELEWFDLTHPSWDVLDKLLSVAACTGTVDRLHTGSAFPGVSGSEAMVLNRLAAICASHGLRVMVEPIAFGGIRSLHSVRKLIRHAGRPANVKILYDVWHVWAVQGRLPRIPAHEIGVVQLSGNSAHVSGDPLTDAMDREMPGNGIDQAEVRAFMAWLARQGYTGPVAVEAPHKAYRDAGLPVADIARNAFTGAARMTV